MSMLDLFCSVDEFWQGFAPAWECDLLAAGKRRRRRAAPISRSPVGVPTPYHLWVPIPALVG